MRKCGEGKNQTLQNQQNGEINTNFSVILLNVNGLKFSNQKTQTAADWIK
jgi:hypothetical protein